MDAAAAAAIASTVESEPVDLIAGLSTNDAAARRAGDGPNVLPRPRRRSPVRQLLAQWTHFFALLLWAAAGLAVLAGMPQLAVAIAIVVLINGLFAFLQEHRAERAADRLQQLMPRRVTVRRNGAEVVIDAADLVVGDVVVLRAGDRVCADARRRDGAALAVDTSTMTGESVPERPAPGAAVLAGTFVVEGEALVEVTATGPRTPLAGVTPGSVRAALTTTGVAVARRGSGVVDITVPPPRTTSHFRHAHKYDGRGVGVERSFILRGDGGRPTGASAGNLAQLDTELTRCPAEVLRHHGPRHDLSRWIADVFHDHELADAFHDAETHVAPTAPSEDVETTRRAMLDALRRRHAAS